MATSELTAQVVVVRARRSSRFGAPDLLRRFLAPASFPVRLEFVFAQSLEVVLGPEPICLVTDPHALGRLHFSLGQPLFQRGAVNTELGRNLACGKRAHYKTECRLFYGKKSRQNVVGRCSDFGWDFDA